MREDIRYIDSLPSHWEVIQNRFLFYYDGKKVGTEYNKYQLLSLTTNGVKERDINAVGGKVPTSYDNYQTVKKGQLVFCLFDLDCSAVFSGISNYDGMITSAYDVFSCTNRIDNSFADYWFKYIFSNRYYKMFSKSVRYTITGDMFRSLKTPVPPIEEQKRISTYLLEQENKVDALIVNVQTQIEKLKAYKQSLITEVVTKGLDPTVPMKDSGVEWVSQIPLSWEISRVGLHYTIILGKMLCPSQIDDSYTLEKYYCAVNVHFGEISSDELKEMWFSPVEKEQYRISVGDMLIVEGGAGAGGCAIVQQHTNALIQNSVMIVRNRRGTDNRYLRYWIEFMVKQGYLDVACNKATIPHYTKEKLAKTIIPALSQEEQIQIADYLDEKCDQIDRLIAIKQAKIEKLEQYKKSLIYEYVTGKKEVS